MNRAYLVFGTALCVTSALGCGDNSKQCDPDTTMNVDGVCVGNATTCSDGTILVDGHCEIDPDACQGGTVLVGGKCVEPSQVTADIEEAAEPNGFGLLGEASTAPAGTISLKPVGQHFVIHGKIIPFQDSDADGQQDADVDTYQIDVTGPVMLTVSADGMHGLAGGFVSLALVGATHPLAAWTRFGVNPRGDTSSRQLYLPAAGTYLIAVADSRSLLLTGAAAVAEEGAPDLEYYVSIDQIAATPTTLTATDGVATSSGTLQPGEVKLFAVAMDEGVNNADLAVTIDQVQESLVIANTRTSVTTIRAVADGDAGDGEVASAGVLGIRTGDSQIVVVDSVFDYANAPYDYDLEVTVGTAGALSTNGTSVAQPSDDVQLSTFYYDVSNDGRLVGMNIHFDRPVTGVIVDEEFSIFSLFTFDPQFGFAFRDTFQDYVGLLNHERAGRYYFLVFDPEADPADITATSTYAGLQPMPITFGTPLTGQAPNAYASTPYTYTPGASAPPWQQFTGSGTGTGDITTTFYRPTTAFGRLDPLVHTCGASCEDSPAPIFTHFHEETGTTFGRVMLDDMTATYLVKVRTETTTGTPAFDLRFEARPFTDLGTATPGTPISQMDQTLDATTTLRRYLVRTAAGNRLTMTAHPDVATLDTRIVQLSRDEAPLATANNGGVGADDTLQMFQSGAGWTAFTVTAPTTILGDQFDLDVTAGAPIQYTRTVGTTAFSDACTGGGTAVAMTNADEGRSAATIATPAGFDFFGFPVAQLRVFSNGFLSFNTALACTSTGSNCFFSNADIPAAANPNSLVAPYWDDIEVSSVCQKTDGTKLIIQWQGTLFSTGTPAVLFQAILDGSNDTIEFVYDTTHAGNGVSATIGLENQVGGAASKVGFNTANTATATLFTP